MKILIIQTAFIGDVVLATSLIEKLSAFYPNAKIDFLLKKGNESLLKNNPKVSKVIIFDKSQGKFKSLFSLVSSVRKEKYTHVINVHRFFSSGLVTVLSGAQEKIGFNKNPLSFLFSKSVKHSISSNGSLLHEVERNQKLIEHITDKSFAKPKLYPSNNDFNIIPKSKYVCIAPSSVWFTKQLPVKKWRELISLIPNDIEVFLLGSASDVNLCDTISLDFTLKKIHNVCGKLSFLESAALMSVAKMNYVNDSAPAHFASAMNAAVTVFYCSTVPQFGFGPLSKETFVLETSQVLSCRPCGLHGKKFCPKGHFKCGEIDIKSTNLC